MDGIGNFVGEGWRIPTDCNRNRNEVEFLGNAL